MYLIGVYGMPIQILNHFDWMHFPLQLDLVGFHGLLNFGTDFTQASINASLPDASVGGILHRFQELIIDRVKCNSEGCINDAPLNLCAKINFADIIIFQHHVIKELGRAAGRRRELWYV